MAEIDAFWAAYSRVEVKEPDWKFYEAHIKIPSLVKAHQDNFRKVTGGQPIRQPAAVAADLKAFQAEFAAAHAQGLGQLRGDAYLKAASAKAKEIAKKYPNLASGHFNKPADYDRDGYIKARQAELAKSLAAVEKTDKLIAQIKAAASDRTLALQAKLSAVKAEMDSINTVTMQQWIAQNPEIAKMVWAEIEDGDYTVELTDAKRSKYASVLERVSAQ